MILGFDKIPGDGDDELQDSPVKPLKNIAEAKLAALIKGDIDDFIRMGESKDPRALEPLIKALGDTYEKIRCAAGEALAKFRDVHAFEHLIKPVTASGNGQNALDKIGNLMDITLVKKSGEDTSG